MATIVLLFSWNMIWGIIIGNKVYVTLLSCVFKNKSLEKKPCFHLFRFYCFQPITAIAFLFC